MTREEFCKGCVHVNVCEDQNYMLRESDAYECFERMEQPKQGEWIDESVDSLKCTACGNRVYKPFIGGFPTERTKHYAPNYCAFCGARMKEGDEK